MKKVNTDVIEKMAKQKNIDKDQIEKIAEGYKGKSESELMDELVKIGKTLQGKEEVISKLKNFLDVNQRKKIDSIMSKISEAEAKNKKSTSNEKSSAGKKVKKSMPNKNNSKDSDSSLPAPTKKTKKVVKKVKRTNVDS